MIYNIDICNEKVGYIHNFSWKSDGRGRLWCIGLGERVILKLMLVKWCVSM